MPILQINTSLSKADVPPNFKTNTCELMADIFKAPLNVRKWNTIQIHYLKKNVENNQIQFKSKM